MGSAAPLPQSRPRGVGPPGGHRLEPGVEADALHAVDVGVAEQGLLPATERVVGHGYRYGHVDADHAHLDVAAEPAGGMRRHG